MDIMDSCRRTDRASEKAREALVDVVGHPLLSSEEDASVIEVSDWIDGYADPSAGDFCEVLEVLDGEIAVEVGEDLFIVYGPAGFVPYIRHDDGQVSYSPESDDGEDAEDWLWVLDLDPVRLLHRTDEELPGAVQEAMEGEQG